METVKVLIETYWNVNSLTAVGSSSRERVLIETYWNVNTLEDVIEQTGTTVLIETYWNVNKADRRLCSIMDLY